MECLIALIFFGFFYGIYWVLTKFKIIRPEF